MKLDLIGKRHPLSHTDFDTPGGGGSDSSSSQATTSTSDNHAVAADSNGVAIGAGADYVNEFGPDVADTVNKALSGVFNFGGNTVAALNTNTSQALSSVSAVAENALNNSNNDLSTVAALAGSALGASSNAVNNASNIASEALNNSQLGQTSILTNPAVLIAGVVAIGLIVYFSTKRR